MYKDKIGISIVIITQNEEKRIAECLDSVSWADEIIIVDDFSKDSTLNIAKRYTDKVFQRKMDIEGRHRNYAYSLAVYDWIFSLDADERISHRLRDSIKEAISNPGRYVGFTVPMKTYIGRHWIRYGGWYPARKLRLFRKDKFRWEEVDVHPRAFMDGPCGHLDGDLIHYSYPNIEGFISKMNNQTTREAEKWLDKERPVCLCKALERTIDRFFRSYILKKGYKDGVLGFIMAYLSSIYQMVSFAKYWEMKEER